MKNARRARRTNLPPDEGAFRDQNRNEGALGPLIRESMGQQEVTGGWLDLANLGSGMAFDDALMIYNSGERRYKTVIY